MQITVRYFAAFREAAGRDVEPVETGAANPAALFDECRARHPGLQRYSASQVAVNDCMADWDSALQEGDEVLFFPPVAGG